MAQSGTGGCISRSPGTRQDLLQPETDERVAGDAPVMTTHGVAFLILALGIVAVGTMVVWLVKEIGHIENIIERILDYLLKKRTTKS